MRKGWFGNNGTSLGEKDNRRHRLENTEIDKKFFLESG